MRCAIGPQSTDAIVAAVEAGGGTVVGLDEAPEALVWLSPRDADGLRGALADAPTVRWVQLPFAGIESFLDQMGPDRTWTCAKGVYAEPTAEHALALVLAGLRRLPEHARATSVTGAVATVGLAGLDAVLPSARVVVLALALTPETEQVIGARQLALMRPDAWLVNVARGRHVDHDALAEALAAGRIGGAALDVTDPEPLPDDSPLWHLPTCLITPHTANPWQGAQPLLSQRITDNVRRYAAGEPLLGLVDLDAGY